MKTLRNLSRAAIAAVVGLALTAHAGDFKALSFLNPGISAVMLTNNIGVTNMDSIVLELGNHLTTNYTLLTGLYYTNNQPIQIACSNNYYTTRGGATGLSTQTVASLPGLLVMVTNNAPSQAAQYGSLFATVTNAQGAVYAKFSTNDVQNMFTDIDVPPDVNLSQVTNVAMGTISFTTVAAGSSGAGSNNIAYTLVPLWDGINEETATNQWIVGTFTNQSTLVTSTGVTPYFLPNTYHFQVPSTYVGCKKLRLRSMTATGTANPVWLIGAKYNGWRP